MSYTAMPSRSLISQEDQSTIARSTVPRSRFEGSFSKLMTFDAGYLVPFLVDEVLPGDTLKYQATAFLRMATPLFPLLSNQRVDTFFFFVPARLLWSNFKRFMGEQPQPGASIDFTIPQVESAVGGFTTGSLADYFGIPVAPQTDAAAVVSVNALPFRAYRLIMHEWFRDENQNDWGLPGSVGDGPDTVASYPVRVRGKAHDYFTSALPWPQKFQAPLTPLKGFSPVFGIGGTGAPGGPFLTVTEYGGASAVYTNGWDASTGNFAIRADGSGGTAAPVVTASLSEGTGGFDINAFRQAFLLQALFERDARGGTRYTEIMLSHFDVRSPDARLQRPEYIGGGSSPLNITPIAQTAPADVDSTESVVGQLGAAATAVGDHSASYAATEHGYVIGIINVRTELAYQQGLHRMWTRRTRYDFAWPGLAGLGEQAVFRGEIFHTGVPANDDVVFGYQERYHEYRTRYSEVTGLFRSYVTGSIDQWHLAQEFSTAPVLGSTFIADSPPMDRVLAAGELAAGQQYLADILVRRSAVRALPVYGTPAMFRF